MSNDTSSIYEAVRSAAEALRLATEVYENVEREESAARTAATAALNRMNDAQRALDSALNALKAKAPQRSDWREDVRRQASNQRAA